jgi:hypothetical protein
VPQSIPREEREHLDSIAFWKQAYEQSEAAQTKLLDRIYELEQDQTTPRDGLAFPEVPASPIPTRKRKRNNETAAKANSQSKRRDLMAKTLRSPESVKGDALSTEKTRKPEELQNCPSRIQQCYSFSPSLTRFQQSQPLLCGIFSTCVIRLSQSGRTPVHCIRLYERHVV